MASSASVNPLTPFPTACVSLGVRGTPCRRDCPIVNSRRLGCFGEILLSVQTILVMPRGNSVDKGKDVWRSGQKCGIIGAPKARPTHETEAGSLRRRLQVDRQALPSSGYQLGQLYCTSAPQRPALLEVGHSSTNGHHPSTHICRTGRDFIIGNATDAVAKQIVDASSRLKLLDIKADASLAR